MIELTHEQRQALQAGEVLVRDSVTDETYVLVRRDVYERIKNRIGYDDGPWTDEEMDLLAEEAGEMLDRYQP